MNVKPCVLYKNCFANKENGDEACWNCSKSKKWEEGKLPCLIDNQEYLFESLFRDRNEFRMSKNEFTYYIIGHLAALEFAGYDTNYIYENLFLNLIDNLGYYMNQKFVEDMKSCRSHE